MRPNRFATLLCSLTAVACTFTSCQKDPAPPAILPVSCATPATVRDLTGLDGCGMVLELKSGQRLEPTGSVWQNFKATDGQPVLIDFTRTSNASACMVGQVVEITCIRASSTITGAMPSGN